MTERRFSDKEVALVLRRAIELEEVYPLSDLPAARGMTLLELQEVPREAGINPSLVTRAAEELSEKPIPSPSASSDLHRQEGSPCPSRRGIQGGHGRGSRGW